jgi:hypothetical protein
MRMNYAVLKSPTTMPLPNHRTPTLAEEHKRCMLLFSKSEADFSRGVCDKEDRYPLLKTHPYLPCSRGRFCASTLCPMILAAVNLYSLLQYLGLATSRKAEQLAMLRPHRGEAMQDIG